jgi:Ca-activated chloride channel family protein
VLSLFIIILANPSTSNTKQEETRNGIDIALVLDISKSMLAEDITPNRIEAAKNVITDFISRLKSDRLAITIFAGKPFVSVPLTFDYDALKEFTKNITTDSVNQNQPGLSGTAI